MTLFTIIKYHILNIFLFSSFTASMVYGTQSKESDKELTSLKLPPCQACKMVVESFTKGMERTARNHFGGGDTAWEEKNLGSYATSEVRLVEIQEHLCEENRAKDQCLTLAEAWEQHLEDWWLGDHKDSSDLVQYLCVDTVKHCCPSGHYGPACHPCPGYPDNICNKNGKCKGNGTRKGDGQCSCDVGYTGQFCDNCDTNYYISYKDDKKLLCSKCHVACKGPCTQAGVKGCLVCMEGWSMDSEKGCLDVNECYALSSCKKNEFCVNNEGSYSCLACDPSCEGCSGDGPDMCLKCANGFVLKDNVCVVPPQIVQGFTGILRIYLLTSVAIGASYSTYPRLHTASSSPYLGLLLYPASLNPISSITYYLDSSSDESYSDMSRYLTYLGLCVATCIIFNNSPVIASGLGLFVAVYVTTSEYMFGTLQNNNLLSSVLKYFK